MGYIVYAMLTQQLSELIHSFISNVKNATFRIKIVSRASQPMDVRAFQWLKKANPNILINRTLYRYKQNSNRVVTHVVCINNNEGRPECGYTASGWLMSCQHCSS